MIFAALWLWSVNCHHNWRFVLLKMSIFISNMWFTAMKRNIASVPLIRSTFSLKQQFLNGHCVLHYTNARDSKINEAISLYSLFAPWYNRYSSILLFIINICFDRLNLLYVTSVIIFISGSSWPIKSRG